MTLHSPSSSSGSGSESGSDEAPPRLRESFSFRRVEASSSDRTGAGISSDSSSFSSSSSLSDIKTNWLSVELEASDFLTLTVYEPKNKEWIKPDLREGIPIKAGTPFLQLTPSEKFATDFKEGKLLVTATDIWNQKVTREITIQSIQPPRLQGFPAIINIFCGQANYLSEIGTSYLDLYPLVFLDPLAKTDKEKLEWSWRIWDDNKKVYREPEKSD